MIKKRFTYFKVPIGFAKQAIKDNVNNEVFDFTLSNVLDKLNEQQEIIQDLERKLKKYEKIGEEQLKQIIDLQDELKEYKTKPTLVKCMNEKRYNPVYENGKIIKVTGNYGNDMVCVEQMIDELNDLNQTWNIWMKYAKKLEKLLYEKIKPTYNDNVYLDIDEETERCKYEHTHICLDFKCDYYSTYFLNCMLMMEDGQLMKAKELGLVK